MHVQTLVSQEQFRELSKRVQIVLSHQKKRGYRFELLAFFVRLGLYACGILLFSFGGWLFQLIGLVLASFGFYAVAITGTHETRHGCFQQSERLNRLWAYFFSDFWSGQSNVWWHHRHTLVHHTQTNIPSKEPSLFYYPWIKPFVYFFIAPFFVNGWLFVNSVKFLKSQPGPLLTYLLLQTLGWLFHIWVFALFVSWPLAIVFAVLMRALFAPLFMHIAVFNHIGLPELDRKPAWLPHQSITTRNLKPHILLTLFGGNAFIECHIEHHLFPNISNHLLGKIHPIVRSFLKEQGYAYTEEGYISCLNYCLKSYHQIFQRSPIHVIEL
jgi:fatty acid desaturase